ncbi:MAG TPA: polysaccharide deacetylase family protein [Anaerolineales bacterium]|jgi:peptidoglycan/xylan/chitin deacetylase (PgdA/CDA1 family)
MDNRFISFGVRAVSHSGLVPVIEFLEAHQDNLLRILVYHRIGDPEAENGQLDPSLLSATPEQLEQQMSFLKGNYRLLSIVDLIRAIDNREHLPPKSIMVTFDDGYHDFLDTAWPILERYQIPTLMFLSTGFLSAGSQMYWWDRLYQGISRTRRKQLRLSPACNYPLENKEQRWRAFIELKKKFCTQGNDLANQYLDRIMEELDVTINKSDLLMNWCDARHLKERGCYLAGHTRSHPILSRMPVETALQEIRDSQKDILQEIGEVWPIVAYPSGQSEDCNKDLQPLLQRDGFKLAMSSIPGINVFPGCDLLRMKRIGLSHRVRLPEFRMILTGIYHFPITVQAKVLNKD